MDTDPWCVHEPGGTALIQPLAAKPNQLSWSDEAAARLSRVPSFLRKMVANRAEAYVRELGLDTVTEEHLATLAARRFGSGGPPRPAGSAKGSSVMAEAQADSDAEKSLPWSEQAREQLAKLPAFFREGVRAVAEDVARAEGRLEVNVKLLERLQSEERSGRALAWSDEAERLLQDYLEAKPAQARLFIQPALESATEQFSRNRRAARVERADAEAAIARLTGGVEWEDAALARVLSAPDFVRAGIKKAAEFRARKEGLARITPGDLTRFRNQAMMRAVQRMKGFGMQELSFDAYAIARERVPRLVDNPEADKRFEAIRSFVGARPAPGELLGRELLEKMRAELRTNNKEKSTPDEDSPALRSDG